MSTAQRAFRRCRRGWLVIFVLAVLVTVWMRTAGPAGASGEAAFRGGLLAPALTTGVDRVVPAASPVPPSSSTAAYDYDLAAHDAAPAGRNVQSAGQTSRRSGGKEGQARAVISSSRTAFVIAAEGADAAATTGGRDALGRFTSGSGGDSAAAATGRSAHLNYENTLGGGDYVFNRALPGSRLRPDAVSYSERIIRELKPDNPGAISSGWRQVNGYKSYLEGLTGKSWTAYVDVYSP